VTARRSILAAAGLLGLLGTLGCNAGPAYRRPAVDVPGGFREETPAEAAGSIADLPWWEVFHDPALVRLLSEAVANNQDLAAALARVAQARASAGVARAERFPRVDFDFDTTRTRRSESLDSFGPNPTEDYRAAIGASWEVDLWGRVRRGAEAAYADFVASEEGRRGAIVALVGDVAEAYFDLIELDAELEVTRSTRAAREGTASLFERRVGAGTASSLEKNQAEADLAVARAAISDVERRLGQQENKVAFLLGRAPGAIARADATAEPALPPQVPTGLPCALLERRPDVRQAEEAVRAANARIGVAQASMYPRIDLTAFIGLESDDLGALVRDRSRIASVGASLAAPVFHGGALKAERARAVGAWEEAVALYRKAVQSALRDVADQLIAIRTLAALRAETENVVTALQSSLTLASKRYEQGLSSYFEVLDAQRRLFPARLELARATRDQHVALVRLYRALGGGWLDFAAGPVAPAVPPR
jgi:multidrug efflux system outer membrane protein